MRKANKNQSKQSAPTFNLVRKTAIVTLVGLGITFSSVAADDQPTDSHNDSTTFKTVYHVYVNNNHVGQVSDKSLTEKIIKQKISDKKEDYADLKLNPASQITYVPEMVFDPETKDSVVEQAIEDIGIVANAVELKVGDNVVGYFKDLKTAQSVVKAYEEKYVDKADIEEFDKLKQALREKELKEKRGIVAKEPSEEDEMSVGDVNVLNISLSEDVSYDVKKVKPKEVLTKKEGVKLLEKGTLEDKIYEVEKGDVLGSIAAKFDLTTDEILDINPDLEDEDAILQIGQELNVTAYEPYVDVNVEKEELLSETIDYETEVKTSDDMYKGTEKVTQEGSEGKKNVHYKYEIVNGEIVKTDVLDEDVTKKAVNKVIVKGSKVIPSRGTGNLVWPTSGGYVSSHVGSRWGSFHKGMDIARPSNRTIKAIDNGVVVSAGWNSGGYGNKIVINHNNGMKSVYAHLSSISVSPGQTVVAGSKIGVMGSTGNSTGVHLHLEIYKNGSLQHPSKYF